LQCEDTLRRGHIILEGRLWLLHDAGVVAILDKNVVDTFPARTIVDLLQGLQLRAKAGIAREQLLQDARSYVPLILGKQI
jgi:hypothetical protein